MNLETVTLEAIFQASLSEGIKLTRRAFLKAVNARGGVMKACVQIAVLNVLRR